MKKRDKIVLWPAYFDSTKTRQEGRRVPKSLAIPTPKLEEVQRAAKQTGLHPEVIQDAGHPSVPWRKTGLIMVSKRGSKTQILQTIAKALSKVRKQS